jgi:hypothetical protein
LGNLFFGLILKLLHRDTHLYKYQYFKRREGKGILNCGARVQ